MLGPVQVLVVAVADEAAVASVLASVAALPDDGPVRHLDAFEITVADDGDIVVESERSPTVALFAGERGDTGGAADGETWSLADVVPRGARAVVVLLEHRWAIALREALHDAGAALVHESWLDEHDRGELERLLGT